MKLGDDLDDEAQGRRPRARAACESPGRTRRAYGDPARAARRVSCSAKKARRRRRARRAKYGYLAALALELAGTPGIAALAADTDGIDGHGDMQEACRATTLTLGAERGLSLAELLARHDTYRYFDACGDLLKTGPTRTNVNDFRLILCEP